MHGSGRVWIKKKYLALKKKHTWTGRMEPRHSRHPSGTVLHPQNPKRPGASLITTHFYLGVEPKIGGWKTPKMDGVNFMENPIKMYDLGGFTPKWMVFFMEKPIKMYDLGGFTTPIFTPTSVSSPKNNLTIELTAPRHTSLLRTSHPSETFRKSRPPSRTAATASSLMRCPRWTLGELALKKCKSHMSLCLPMRAEYFLLLQNVCVPICVYIYTHSHDHDLIHIHIYTVISVILCI